MRDDRRVTNDNFLRNGRRETWKFLYGIGGAEQSSVMMTRNDVYSACVGLRGSLRARHYAANASIISHAFFFFPFTISRKTTRHRVFSASPRLRRSGASRSGENDVVARFGTEYFSRQYEFQTYLLSRRRWCGSGAECATYAAGFAETLTREGRIARNKCIWVCARV